MKQTSEDVKKNFGRHKEVQKDLKQIPNIGEETT